MSTLTRSNGLGKTRARMAPSFTPSVTLGPSWSLRLKGDPQVRGKNGAEHIWGTDLKKFEAEDLLDWLEAHGHQGQVTFVAGKGFTVQ
jgi:hypothetical protein